MKLPTASAEQRGHANRAILSDALQQANERADFICDPFNFTYLEVVTHN